MDEEYRKLCEKIKKLEAGEAEQPTLVYFNIIGIVWPVRCLLTMCDVEFEDLEVSVKQWGYREADGTRPLKDSFTSLHMPLYADKDIVITQSMALMDYLARKHDMAGDSESERVKVLEIMGQCHDALFHWCGLLPIIAKSGVDGDTFDKRMAAFMGSGRWGLVSDGYDFNLRGFENYLKRNQCGSGFMVGDHLTFADLHAFNVLCNWYKAFNRERFSKYTLLDDYIKRIASIPAVSDYIESVSGYSTWLPMPNMASNLTSAEELFGLLD